MATGDDKPFELPPRENPWWLRPLLEANPRRRITSFLGSLIAHSLVLLALATFFHHVQQRGSATFLIVTGVDPVEDMQTADIVTAVPSGKLDTPSAASLSAVPDADQPHVQSIATPSLGKPVEAETTVVETVTTPTTIGPAPGIPTAKPVFGFVTGGGFEGRTRAGRSRLAGGRGATPQSEDAVEAGLAWLAAHQRVDGGWRFDLRDGPCGGRCGNSGTPGTTTGATALALLPFLGAGYLPQDPKYGPVVERGLYYLKNRVLMTPYGGDLQEGSMYGHGLATITLCEAYALTHDESLRPIAQAAINFTCHVQHPKGGWRYYPGQPGDTTMFGWQFMSLKSARMAGLMVPSPVIERAKDYLDSVQSHYGSHYGYLRPEKDFSPTAIGLLSRMYTGWPRDDERLQRGVDFIAKRGPQKSDMYFNYYATQLMHHYGGSLWNEWNNRMRDYLVATQSKMGHEKGSWHFTDTHGTVGGRLYTTGMCIMILEVYYRHMPIYGEQTLEGF